MNRGLRKRASELLLAMANTNRLMILCYLWTGSARSFARRTAGH